MSYKIERIFLIDDDQVYQYLTKKVMEDSHIVKHIDVFSNGLQAIKHLESRIDEPSSLPEVIFLDLSMPVMDGWEFLDEFKRIANNIKKTIVIYIVSSSISPSDINKANQQENVRDYIIKPITKKKFIELLENFV